MDRVAFYIDGFNLYFGIKHKIKKQGWRNCLWLDLCALCDALMRPNQKRVICKYFTARISGNNHKQRKQTVYLEALKTFPDLEIIYGRFQMARQLCSICDEEYFKPEEKMTDVNIAIEMVQDAHANKFDIAILISADSDFVPPVQILQSLGKKVIVALPPRNKSQQLRNTADAVTVIGRGRIYQNQLPEKIIGINGYELCKPADWS